eukprot:CAMPEP_0117076322 /NCGR_PEP_ID=MMETSP0472-20121206/53796_1 /TAXON_ID=693140 ORGANISM="Tiarina fusus, Strain LIS" /NCGR_SAMPLE_ID=MMETSP0472 /ASSEMBLY_ACC=CAM_ASM_000603 /LENGTH=270 /DNA_ID=CAMNT_0004802163 /DNA_START=109 /DNA_END=922 /DNA_ORIENTATION=-
MDTGSHVGDGQDDKRQPLSPHGGSVATSHHGARTTSLNERLNTDYVDVGPDEHSVSAQMTKGITGCVGNFVTPRHLLVVLRVLKAITFCFLILTVAADIMYIAFLEVLPPKKFGTQWAVTRIYGLFLAGMAIAIELDVARVVRSFYGFKGFIPRGLLLFFISAITGAHPLHGVEVQIGDDDAQYDDDYIDDTYVASVNSEIPKSAVVFQMVTSFILGLCAITYFTFGVLCLDRFTSKAFLSSKDPLVTTAIPQPSGVAPSDIDSSAYRTP